MKKLNLSNLLKSFLNNDKNLEKYIVGYLIIGTLISGGIGYYFNKEMVDEFIYKLKVEYLYPNKFYQERLKQLFDKKEENLEYLK